MQVRQISFKNNVTNQIAQGKTSSNPVIMPKQDTDKVEPSKKKKNIIKYSAIGAGILIAIIAIIKRKSLSEFFEKIFKKGSSGPGTPPSPSSLSSSSAAPRGSGGGGSTPPPGKKVQIRDNANFEAIGTEKIEADSKLPQILISKSSLVGTPDKYKPLTQENIWALYDDNRFNNFLQTNPELSEIVSPHLKLYQKNGITPSFLDVVKSTKDNNPWKILAEKMEEKYNLDLSVSPKIYRFIGKQEMDILKAGGKIENLRSGQTGIDVTTNPELNWWHSQYRITFKENNKFSIHPSDEKNSKIRLHGGTNNEDYYYLQTPYTMKDIEKIEVMTKEGFQDIMTKNKSKHSPHGGSLSHFTNLLGIT